MTALVDSHYSVGIISVLALGYTLVLVAIHMYIPHPNISRNIIRLSYTSLVFSVIAVACIVCTYFLPFIEIYATSKTVCMCTAFWWTAATFYILSIYGIKLVYVARIQLLQEHPTIAAGNMGRCTSKPVLRCMKYYLYLNCLFCLAIIFATTEGECHDDTTQYGCKPTIHVINEYIALVCIGIDAMLFVCFCYKWWSVIQSVKHSITDENLHRMVNSFRIELVVTLIALLSVVVDAVLNMFTQHYKVRIVFCIDCAVIASCNFAIIKESRMFMWRYLCCPCSILWEHVRQIASNSDDSASESTTAASSKEVPLKATETTSTYDHSLEMVDENQTTNP